MRDCIGGRKMIKSFNSPECCNKRMQLINSFGSAIPNYYTFQCQSCGKILSVDDRQLKRFAEVGEGVA